ncbi:MAG: prephenate dehydrogenase [Verrucomicrobiota bacterium]
MFRQISIIGPGLLGASIGLAVRERKLAGKIVAWSRRAETRLKCLQNGICDEIAETAADAVKGSDCVILCTPVQTILPLLEEILPLLDPDAAITDVGSTKSLICRQAQGLSSKGPVFIGSHPMAGSDQCGLEHARVDLFQNASCFLTPLDNATTDQILRLTQFWEALGMTTEVISPETHDEIVAHISHLPHALAAVLARYLGSQDGYWANFAGGGLRDTSRVASGDPNLWKQIFSQNKEEVIRSIEGFEQHLQEFKAALLNNEPIKVERFLNIAKNFRDSLNDR